MTSAGMATMMGGAQIGFGTTTMGIARYPKARARSRDYLRHSNLTHRSLQEINYLTSNPVLNPLSQQSALIPGIKWPHKILIKTKAAQQGGPNHPN
ncbi:uncharacterized protein PGTG_21846 [Puccinia graminis f. sp. tritici CRL 75-36-700-3]|uniref:Uncharacterized protein n=1 Tax=Puccinia graminis f. sp. tritici (strain CRL 75-36-700-3 / race SCCL) TaxID=418459 RepID=H6QSK3_PUCGT|nr:uncharacterized protein PGTG_21846 [Puccinia graminis f. sp. tritici CRL 75-36-700-3]EHS63754.1 hypothetical protein PGTG_21846 [Puccinia graminis f. sp. tritici CRL 75-36-700-3]